MDPSNIYTESEGKTSFNLHTTKFAIYKGKELIYSSDNEGEFYKMGVKISESAYGDQDKPENQITMIVED